MTSSWSWLRDVDNANVEHYMRDMTYATKINMSAKLSRVVLYKYLHGKYAFQKLTLITNLSKLVELDMISMQNHVIQNGFLLRHSKQLEKY